MQHGFNWYQYGLPEYITTENELAVAASIFLVVVLTFIAISIQWIVYRDKTLVIPQPKISLINFSEVYYEFIQDMVEGVIGHHGKKYISLIGSIFIFILLSNLMGVIPGLYSPSTNYNMVLALALFVFVIYNLLGILENGIGYLKHFLGPMLFLAPAFFAIEIISHLARPLSLTIRLRTNMFADHQVLNVFSQLAPLGVPVVFYGMGVFVSLVQAYVFTLLTTIYISLAISHDH